MVYITPISSSVFPFGLFSLYTIEKEKKRIESSQRKSTLKRVNRNSNDDSLTSDFERMRSGSKVRSFWELIFRNDAASKSKTCSTLFVRESSRVSQSRIHVDILSMCPSFQSVVHVRDRTSTRIQLFDL